MMNNEKRQAVVEIIEGIIKKSDPFSWAQVVVAIRSAVTISNIHLAEIVGIIAQYVERGLIYRLSPEEASHPTLGEYIVK